MINDKECINGSQITVLAGGESGGDSKLSWSAPYCLSNCSAVITIGLIFIFLTIMGYPKLVFSRVQVENPPEAFHEITVRKKVYYKIFNDKKGYKVTDQTLQSLQREGVPYWSVRSKIINIKNQKFENEDKFLTILESILGEEQTNKFKSLVLKYADNKQRVVAGPMYYYVLSEGALVGNYSSFGVSGITFGIDFDYWEEESYYIFKVYSKYDWKIDENLSFKGYYFDINYGKYFGEASEVDVEIVQLPWNFGDFKRYEWNSDDIRGAIKIVNNESQLVSTLKFGTAQKGSESPGEKLRSLIYIKNLKDVGEKIGENYFYGYYAVRIKHSLIFSECGGIVGYTLTENPITFEVSLTDENGNPLNDFSFNNGVVVTGCINGYTTAGYGFVVQSIDFHMPNNDDGEVPTEEINYINLLDSEYKKFGIENKQIVFNICDFERSIPKIYLEEKIEELGGTRASFWIAETHKNNIYYVDYGANSREILRNCKWVHAYANLGEYTLSIDVEYDIYSYNIMGQLVFKNHVSKKELTRKLLVIKPSQVLSKTLIFLEDTDSDGFFDFEENYYGTDPFSPDTDSDEIQDSDEILVYGTDPNRVDTDGDGLSDGDEIALWGDNWNVDYDGDGLINILDNDSDEDGVNDKDDVFPLDYLRRAHDITPLLELIFVPNGDLNEDGCVDRKDLTKLMNVARGLSLSNPDHHYDINNDGKVNIIDARRLVTMFTNPRGEICE